MNHLYNAIKIGLNKAIDKIAGKDGKLYAKTTNSFVIEQNNLKEIDSLQWDEYGNPYIIC